ncbi:MAG: tyrosine-type recombinase/integrase [Proteobacteria bacterium]|nr:tyrosine-type recombinase/integrase [Pseudomonadota bacterium]
MIKKRQPKKKQPWNKGREIGQRPALSLSQVTRIKKSLAKRGDAGLRDFALFSTAIDTMLRGPDLLILTVKEVRVRNNSMRDIIELTTSKYGQSVQCVLSKATRDVLDKWIKQSAKKPNDYLFTGRVRGGLTPMSTRQLNRLVNTWVEGIGLDASVYGAESLRRTRAIHILNETGNMEAVRIILGLSDIRATARYLSDARSVDTLAINRAHQI